MFGYDWPRLHAALNDLPAALLIGAVLFDLLAAATRREGLRIASFWTLMLGTLGAAAAVISGLQAENHIAHGEAVHRAHGDPRAARAHHRRDLRRAGALAALPRDAGWGRAERALALALGLGGAGVLAATGVYGGKLVFEHAAGMPSAVLQGELHERAEGHHHGAGEEHGDGDEDHEHAEDAHEHPAGRRGDSAAATDSGAPAGHVDPPGTPPHSHPAGTPPHQH